MCQGLGGRATCASELASKYAKVRFIAAIIVMRGWCWGLVLKCYELSTRQHKMLNVNVLRS
jgi:hypothetical protein